MRKLDNWLTAIGAGGIVTILTVLSGFKLDFLEIWKGMGKMNGQHWFLIFFSIAFIVGIAMKISEQRVTPRNVQRKIETWLKRFRFGVKPIQWDKWHFGLQIIEPGVRMYIARPKEREQYISLIAPIIPLTTDLKKTYDSLDDERRALLVRRVMLNAAAAKMTYRCNFIKNTARVSKHIPISSSLSESVLIDAIAEVNQCARIIWDTVTLDLLQKPDTQSALRADKEELPPTLQEKGEPPS